jgi:hypothetical protein
VTGQSSIFDTYPVVDEPVGHVGPPDELTIEEAFLLFHERNPHVYAELVELARRAARRGVTRLGIGMLFEVLRWRHSLRTGGDPFKLNNNYRSYYARLIMLRERDLAGIFETRRLHAGEEDGEW